LVSLTDDQRRFVHTVRQLARNEYKPRAVQYLDGTRSRASTAARATAVSAAADRQAAGSPSSTPRNGLLGLGEA